jgi:hypothetical protein
MQAQSARGRGPLFHHFPEIGQRFFGAIGYFEIPVVHGIPHCTFGCSGSGTQFFHCCITDTSGWQIYYPSQRFFVPGVHGESKIGYKIFYFFPLVKRHASVHSVHEVQPAQVFLKFPALRVGSVQNGDFIIGNMVPVLLLQYHVGHTTPSSSSVRHLTSRILSRSSRSVQIVL